MTAEHVIELGNGIATFDAYWHSARRDSVLHRREGHAIKENGIRATHLKGVKYSGLVGLIVGLAHKVIIGSLRLTIAREG